MNLQENISRIKQMMGIINERVSKKIIDFFGENGFFKGVFPHSIYETNEFVKVLFHDDDLAINVDDIGFFYKWKIMMETHLMQLTLAKKLKGWLLQVILNLKMILTTL